MEKKSSLLPRKTSTPRPCRSSQNLEDTFDGVSPILPVRRTTSIIPAKRYSPSGNRKAKSLIPIATGTKKHIEYGGERKVFKEINGIGKINNGKKSYSLTPENTFKKSSTGSDTGTNNNINKSHPVSPEPVLKRSKHGSNAAPVNEATINPSPPNLPNTDSRKSVYGDGISCSPTTLANKPQKSVNDLDVPLTSSVVPDTKSRKTIAGISLSSVKPASQPDVSVRRFSENPTGAPQTAFVPDNNNTRKLKPGPCGAEDLVKTRKSNKLSLRLLPSIPENTSYHDTEDELHARSSNVVILKSPELLNNNAVLWQVPQRTKKSISLKRKNSNAPQSMKNIVVEESPFENEDGLSPLEISYPKKNRKTYVVERKQQVTETVSINNDVESDNLSIESENKSNEHKEKSVLPKIDLNESKKPINSEVNNVVGKCAVATSKCKPKKSVLNDISGNDVCKSKSSADKTRKTLNNMKIVNEYNKSDDKCDQKSNITKNDNVIEGDDDNIMSPDKYESELSKLANKESNNNIEQLCSTSKNSGKKSDVTSFKEHSKSDKNEPVIRTSRRKTGTTKSINVISKKSDNDEQNRSIPKEVKRKTILKNDITQAKNYECSASEDGTNENIKYATRKKHRQTDVKCLTRSVENETSKSTIISSGEIESVKNITTTKESNDSNNEERIDLKEQDVIQKGNRKIPLKSNKNTTQIKGSTVPISEDGVKQKRKYTRKNMKDTNKNIEEITNKPDKISSTVKKRSTKKNVFHAKDGIAEVKVAEEPIVNAEQCVVRVGSNNNTEDSVQSKKETVQLSENPRVNKQRKTTNKKSKKEETDNLLNGQEPNTNAEVVVQLVVAENSRVNKQRKTANKKSKKEEIDNLLNVQDPNSSSEVVVTETERKKRQVKPRNSSPLSIQTISPSHNNTSNKGKKRKMENEVSEKPSVNKLKKISSSDSNKREHHSSHEDELQEIILDNKLKSTKCRNKYNQLNNDMCSEIIQSTNKRTSTTAPQLQGHGSDENNRIVIIENNDIEIIREQIEENTNISPERKIRHSNQKEHEHENLMLVPCGPPTVSAIRISSRKTLNPIPYWKNQDESPPSKNNQRSEKKKEKNTHRSVQLDDKHVKQCFGLNYDKICTPKPGVTTNTLLHVGQYVMTGIIAIETNACIDKASTDTAYFVMEGVATVSLCNMKKTVTSRDKCISFFIPKRSNFCIMNEDSATLKMMFTKFKG